MRILLVCNQGMSTGILVENMIKHAEDGDVIEALPVSKSKDVAKNYDVVLVGPQIRYKIAEIKGFVADKNIPVEVIDMQAYGMMDGAKVMQQVKEMLKGE